MFLLSVLVVLMLVTTVATSLYLYFLALLYVMLELVPPFYPKECMICLN